MTIFRLKYLLRFIIRLLTQAVQFLSVPRVSAFRTHKLGQGFTHFFSNANTVSMEPVVAKITPHIKSTSKDKL